MTADGKRTAAGAVGKLGWGLKLILRLGACGKIGAFARCARGRELGDVLIGEAGFNGRSGGRGGGSSGGGGVLV
jgi:hypothetical protein